MSAGVAEENWQQPSMHRPAMGLGKGTVMVQGFWRTTWSGVVAGLVFSILSVLTFYLLGVLPGILFNPAIQSPK